MGIFKSQTWPPHAEGNKPLNLQKSINCARARGYGILNLKLKVEDRPLAVPSVLKVGANSYRLEAVWDRTSICRNICGSKRWYLRIYGRTMGIKADATRGRRWLNIAILPSLSRFSLTMGPQLPRVLYLPDTMVNWPWPRAINPHYEEVKAASNAWFEGFKPFTPESQMAFNKCDFGETLFLTQMLVTDIFKT